MSTLGELLKRVAQGTKSAAAENAHIGFFGRGPQYSDLGESLVGGRQGLLVIPENVASEAREIMGTKAGPYGWPAEGSAGYFHDFEREYGLPPGLASGTGREHYTMVVGDTIERLEDLLGPGRIQAREMAWTPLDDVSPLDDPSMLDQVLGVFPEYRRSAMSFHQPDEHSMLWGREVLEPYEKNPYPLREFSLHGPGGGFVHGTRNAGYIGSGAKVHTKLDDPPWGFDVTTPSKLPPHIQKNWEEYQIQDPRLY